MMITSISM